MSSRSKTNNGKLTWGLTSVIVALALVLIGQFVATGQKLGDVRCDVSEHNAKLDNLEADQTEFRRTLYDINRHLAEQSKALSRIQERLGIENR